jgi:hypothetical protein
MEPEGFELGTTVGCKSFGFLLGFGVSQQAHSAASDLLSTLHAGHFHPAVGGANPAANMEIEGLDLSKG